MSFIDIAKLTLHRRHEMELRVDSFLEKCDNVIKNIQKLKNHAQDFPSQLNCEPGELKERYLNCIKQLEEYTYLITDFNIAVNTLDDKDSPENTPVQDINTPNHHQILQPQKLNLMDVLSETAPTTSAQCFNNCQEKKPKPHRNKSEQTLIMFSSTSNSDESLLSIKPTNHDNKTEEQIVENMETTTLNEVNAIDEAAAPNVREWPSLPAQPVLEVDHTYPAIIMGVEGTSFWVTTQDLAEFNNLLTDLENYYKSNKMHMSLDEINRLTYCAFYDEASGTYFRGLIISHPTNENDTAEVYMVDTGSAQNVAVDSIQPLFQQFCLIPPFARCCHLAGVDLPETKEFHAKIESFMNEHLAKNCSIAVDDNTSESLGVFVYLETGDNINDMVVAQGIANKLQSSTHRRNKLVIGLPEAAALSIDDEPEYEDALEAVTGYHNRDEAEICKHYKGGPEKTCFKGSTCKKKHILMHPDGWTLDKVEVLAKYKTIPLPEPGTFIKLLITYVCHFDRVYAHILQSNKQDAPSSSIVVPLSTLQSLEKYMNKPTTIQSYKRFELYPAPGELVAALYPPDGLWYRARVHCHDRLHHTVQVVFIDYGNVMDIQEDTIRQLPEMFAELPVQAVKCVLAGVNRKTENTYNTWVEAKAALSYMTLNKVLEAHVIARNYEDITVELFDEQGYSIAEQLAAKNLIKLASFSVIDDKTTSSKLVIS